MQRWATRNLGPLAVVNQILEQAPELASNLYRLPELLRQDTLPLRVELAKQNQVLEDLQLRLTRMRRNQRLGIGVMMLIIAAMVTTLA
jgi:hypothetical protein